MQLQDKLVVIHGGTSGIGKELTLKCLSMGAQVIFCGRNQNKGDQLLDEIWQDENNNFSRRSYFYQCDVTDWEAQDTLYDVAAKQFGRTVDIVISVAGILDTSSLTNDEKLGHYQTIDVNLIGAIKATRAAIQHFIKNNKPGLVINTSSLYGYCGAPLAPLYAASKHGIVGLTRSYGSLFQTTDIRVNAVAPHFVDTPMLHSSSRPVANSMGLVPIADCVEAYLRVIQDESLNGDVISVTALGLQLEPRFTEPLYEKLDALSGHRKTVTLDEIKKHFGGQ